MKDKEKLDFIKNSLLKIVEVLSETKKETVNAPKRKYTKKTKEKPKATTRKKKVKKTEINVVEEKIEENKDFTVTRLKDSNGRNCPLEKMVIRKNSVKAVDIKGHQEDYNYLPKEKTKRRKAVKDIDVTCCKCQKKFKVHPQLAVRLDNDKEGDLGFKCDNCVGR